MRQPDNWGWKARIGMFIVGVETVPEAEWWAMMPPGVSVHAARISASTPWAKWSADGQTVEFKDDLALGTCLLYTSPSPRDAESSRMPSSA